ncbi:MAG: 3-phosphoshikimate 1-carboxyvinyltransferase [Clostridia bacterium]|nr:3-phosphoshikimate 1-carboxyvinyltransferase [Clostridia bacterium]
MKVTISKSHAKGSLLAPPSKSMAHRLLIAAGLAFGKSIIQGVAPSEDILATIDCLKALGAECHYENDTVTVTGIGGKIKQENATLFCRECGSTLRFFVPIALLSESTTVFTGSERLLSRPMSIYEAICQQQHLVFEHHGSRILVKGKLSAGHYTVPGNISSQFISGLLFALPLLDNDSTITVTEPIESRSYIDLTVKALADFGVFVRWQNRNTLLIQGNQTYLAQQTRVEGDYSNAAFFSALSYLGGEVKLQGLDANSLQGDRVYQEFFEQLQAGTPTLSLADCPDLGPILFALAGALNGATFTNTARLSIKESDRGDAMAEELAKFGIRCTVQKNEITVIKENLHTPSTTLYGHNDHRIVMALSVLLTQTGGCIEGAEAVSKSMPDFFDRLQELGITLTVT